MIVSYRMDGDYPDPAWTDEGRFPKRTGLGLRPRSASELSWL